MNFNFRRRVFALSCAVATAMIGVDFMATKSIVQAQLLPVICPIGSETATYNPPITTQTQNTTVNIQGSVGQCIGSQPIISGNYNFTVPYQISCNNVGIFPTYSITYNWNTGQSTKVDYTFTSINLINGQLILTSTGTAVNGLFQGRTVQRTITLLATDITACPTQGISSIAGPQTLTILGSL
ncbi:hypothetical protein A6770_02500 [Nostoc minutum NIES-26]|uniref:Uncharacterized protein n=1 Tax=Nostoc minutum NIES-26 TaxID=1844469 RepID=A0A367QV30_9NOSO|nr:hypothetical protein A6770_02500 [Nostoc minutum NIES-26]